VQLKGPGGSLQLGIVAASCALLSATARAQTAPDTSQSFELDSAVLYYKENAGRVQAVEPVVSLKKDFGDQRVLAGTFTADTLSGATPNGAIASRKPQTFASPSSSSLTPQPGRRTRLYTIAPGDLPQDPNFSEQRFAGDADWSQPLSLNDTLSVGGHVSTEHDFDSFAAHSDFSHDFNEKNTVISGGVSVEHDLIQPHGGTPAPDSDYTLYEHEGNQTKTVTGALVGVTQVLTRTWLTQINYTLDHSHGYLTDPYRILSVLDSTGAVAGYRYEDRPDSRTRQSIYWLNKAALGPTVLDVSYRRGKDSWDIDSDTVEAHLHIGLTHAVYVEPLVRWYHQGAASFYDLYLNGSAPLPLYASADPRLAAFIGTTFGLKFGVSVGHYGDFSLRLEEYEQRPSDNSSSLPQLRGLNLNPDLRATIAQVSWRFLF
jgi:hypothetical protein